MNMDGDYMLILAVVVGYILGTLPFLVNLYINRVPKKKIDSKSFELNKEILDEYLNGPSKTKKVEEETKINKNTVDTERIFKEYIGLEAKDE